MRQPYNKQRGLSITALMWSMRKLYTKQRGLSVITKDVVDEAIAYQAARGLSVITKDVVDEAVAYRTPSSAASASSHFMWSMRQLYTKQRGLRIITS